MVSSKSPCRLERWGQLLFSSHRRWQTFSESWVLKWFVSAAPTSSSVMPRAAARRSPPTKGAISHRRSCARSLGTSACRWRSSSATAECLLGIKTGVAVCQEALQRYSRGRSAGHSPQALPAGQGSWDFSTVAGAFGRFATRPVHTHRIPRPFLAPRQGLGHAPSGGVGFSAVLKLASRASPSRRQQQVLLSRPKPSAVLHSRPARPWFAPLPAAEQASLQFPICGASSPVPCSITCAMGAAGAHSPSPASGPEARRGSLI